MANKPRIVVAGAGALGCFVGGLLAAAGRDVTLLVRPNVATEIRAHGLTLTDFTGLALRVPAQDITLAENDPACLADADVILVTTKPSGTGEIGRAIAKHARSDAIVISLQDGVHDCATLRTLQPDADLRGGIVAFHVVRKGQGCIHRETNGEVFVAAGEGRMATLLATPHLIVSEVDNIINLQWGRVLINLNSALNALSGLRLQHQLSDSNWRWVMAAQWAEALRVMRAAGLRPALGTSTPIGLIPSVLRLPQVLFLRTAGPILDMDPQTRSLISHDLAAGVATQVDTFQGAVVDLGTQAGVATPINSRVQELVRLAETAAQGVPNLPVSAIRSAQ